MKIICISGHAGNGKDLTASILKEELEKNDYRVIITHYADLVKFICEKYFNWNGKKDEIGRSLLQRIGTDVVRAKNPNYWVDFVANLLEYFPDEWDYVLIPDTRFPNEIDRLKDFGYDVITVRVNRLNYISSLTAEQQAHLSETSLDDYKFDHVIENDTIISLTENIQNLISKI